jgi:ESCRT-II complex subunit VPS36
MTLQVCSKPIDGSIPVQALLFEDEQLMASQDGIGIYEGYVQNFVCVGGD